MKKLITTTLIAAIAATSISASALAGPFGGPGNFAPGGGGPVPPVGPGDFAPGGGGGGGGGDGPKPPKGVHGNGGKTNGFDALGAGLLGFGVGAMVGAMSQPRPQPAYSADPHQLCAQRYKSYDAYSRTFLSTDSNRYLCPYWGY